MNWYLAYLLFAQKADDGRRRIKCESCHVLFEAQSALQCYEKAVKWAGEHERENSFKFVGVEHLNPILDEPPGDGTEIDGKFFDDEWVWQRIRTLIPQKEDIPVIKLEQNMKRPLGEVMTKEQKKELREILGEEQQD